MKKNDLSKNFIWNMIGSFTNAFISLILMIIVTRINGVNEAGVFSFAFSIACLFQVVAYYAGRTFQVTNNDKDLNDTDFIYNRIISCLIMLFFVIVYLFIKNYSIYKNIVILLFVFYRMIEAYCDAVYGVIQKNNDLYKVGISLFLKSVIGLLLFLIIDITTRNILIAINSLIFVQTIILLLYDRKNYLKYYVKSVFKFVNVIKIFKLGLFVFGFTFLIQYILNVPKYVIDDLLASKYQTIYNIIVMPATFITLCSQFIIQPFLIQFKTFVADNNYLKLKKLTLKILIYVFIVGIFSVLVAYLLGIPCLELVYGIKLSDYLIHLVIIIIGASLFGLSFIVSTVLITMRKTLGQIIIYLIASIYITIVSSCFVSNYNLLGASLAYSSTMFILAILYISYYYFILRKELKK